MVDLTAADDRSADLRHGLELVAARVRAACATAGRDDEPSIIVVTKRFPRADVDRLHQLGVADVGENTAQELEEKFADPAPGGPTVHFIGRLQSNKAGVVARRADVVHSLDRRKLVTALARHRPAGSPDLQVLLQISLDGDPARGGVAAADAPALADLVAATPGLLLRGVMAVAPLGADPDAAFADLREVRDGIRQDHPQAGWLSAGMSGDLEAAIRQGATHLRVGSAILGTRASLG